MTEELINIKWSELTHNYLILLIYHIMYYECLWTLWTEAPLSSPAASLKHHPVLPDPEWLLCVQEMFGWRCIFSSKIWVNENHWMVLKLQRKQKQDFCCVTVCYLMSCRLMKQPALRTLFSKNKTKGHLCRAKRNNLVTVSVVPDWCFFPPRSDMTGLGGNLTESSRYFTADILYDKWAMFAFQSYSAELLLQRIILVFLFGLWEYSKNFLVTISSSPSVCFKIFHEAKRKIFF